MKALLIGMITATLLTYETLAVSKDGFVLSVIHDGQPVKEMVEDSKDRVAIPFGSEYKLRLKNTNDRRCSVKVSIDGCNVSALGDVVVDSNGNIDLERFIDASLTEGNKFKFVALDDPAVDDPTKAENGLIEATFTLEKKQEAIEYIVPQWDFYIGVTNYYINCASTLCSASTEAGATVQGRESSQGFRKVSFDGEEESVTLRLWIRGITNDYGITTSESHATHTTDLRHACTNAPYGSNIVNQMTTDDHILAMRNDGNLDAVIKSLADSGDICRVLGHSWREETIDWGSSEFDGGYFVWTNTNGIELCLGLRADGVVVWKQQQPERKINEHNE